LKVTEKKKKKIKLLKRRKHIYNDKN